MYQLDYLLYKLKHKSFMPNHDDYFKEYLM
jgi:hypothetical protein